MRCHGTRRADFPRATFLIRSLVLVDLVTKSWASLKSRDHTVYAVFPFGPKAEEVMMHGRSNNVALDGATSTFTWVARMHFTRSADGSVLIDKYTIIVVSSRRKDHIATIALHRQLAKKTAGPASIHPVMINATKRQGIWTLTTCYHVNKAYGQLHYGVEIESSPVVNILHHIGTELSLSAHISHSILDVARCMPLSSSFPVRS